MRYNLLGILVLDVVKPTTVGLVLELAAAASAQSNCCHYI